MWDALEYPMARKGSPIAHGFAYEELDALVSAGATLDELLKFYNQEYPTEFISIIVAWHRAKSIISEHASDAADKGKKKK